MNPQRGEICSAALDPTVGSEIAKRRPCLILTTDLVNAYRRTVVVVPLSSGPPGVRPREPIRPYRALGPQGTPVYTPRPAFPQETATHSTRHGAPWLSRRSVASSVATLRRH